MSSSVVDPNRSLRSGTSSVGLSGEQSKFPSHIHYPKYPLYSPESIYQADRSNTYAKPRSHSLRERFVPAEGWFVLVLLAIAMYCVVFSIIAANWVDHSMVLLGSPAVGLLMGLLVAKIPRLPQSILHLAACLLGHWLSVWLTSMVAFHVPWTMLLAELRAVVLGGLSGVAIPATGNAEEMVFFFYLSFLCFFLGYFGSWLIYRAHLPWLVAFVYCSITLVNLNYVRHDMLYLFLFQLCALMLLIARVHLTSQVLQWKQEGLHTDRSWMRDITWRCLQAASVLTLIVILFSAIFPALDQPQSGKNFWDGLNNAWVNISNGHFSLQNPGSLTQAYQTPTNFFGDQLTISGTVRLPAGEVLYYTSAKGSHYLEGFTYNQFDGHTWTTTVAAESANMRQYEPNVDIPADVSRDDYMKAVTTVTILTPPEGAKNYIFGPAQPVSFDVATVTYSDGTTTAWTQASPLARDERYTVTSQIPPSNDHLFASVPLPSQSPDAWQIDKDTGVLNSEYREVPHDLSAKVPQAVKQWTYGATNAYDALKMLEAHLSDQQQFHYQIDNPSIPSNVDVVDWLLQTRTGYCTYYASAMAVMGRMLGIPTRIVNGFSNGHFDAVRKVWSVRGDDAHSWVQAYLPGFGWVSFDPTPGFAPTTVKSAHPTPSPTLTPPVRPTATIVPPVKKPQPPPAKQQGQHSGSGNSGAQINSALLAGLSIIVLLLSLFALLLVAVHSWWRGLFPNSTLVTGMFWRLCYLASLVGFSPRASQTPYEYGRMLSQHMPQKSRLLWRLTELFVRDRWGASTQVPRSHEVIHAKKLWPGAWRILVDLVLLKVKK